MAHEIPFHQATFTPRLGVKGNTANDLPVQFDLSAAGGPDLARLRSIVYATAGVETAEAWTPEVQASVIAAFRTGGDVFVHTVDAVRNLTVPAALAKKAGLIAVLPPTGPRTPYPITNGTEFAAVSGWCPLLAFEVAMEITKLSNEAEIDSRFFEPPSTPPEPGSSSTPTGNAKAARQRRGKRGTAAS